MTLSESTNSQKQYVLLKKENQALKEAINEIERRLSSIEASLPKQKTIILREITKEQAKKKIKVLFARGETLYYSDIAEELKLELQTVVEICTELQAEGEIEVSDNVL